MDLSQGTLLQAFGALLGQATTRENRHHAEAYLDQIKQKKEGLPCMLDMLRAVHEVPMSEAYAQLALSILDDWLKIHWNSLSETDQGEVMRSTLQLLMDPPQTLASSQSKAMRSKLAVILCNVAERTFPQQWPTFLEDLVARVWLNGSSSHSQREICISTLEFLVTDCVDNDFNSVLPAQRRQDILTGIREHLEILLQTAFDYLMECCKYYVSQQQQQQQQSEELGLVVGMINATIRLVDRLTGCSKVEEIFTPKHDFSLLGVSMVNLPRVQEEAVSFLFTIVSQKHDSRTLKRLCELVVGTPVTALPGDTRDSLNFQRKYAESVGVLASSMGGVVFDKHAVDGVVDHAQSEVLAKLLNLLCMLMEQPSRRMAGALLKDWLKLFREEGASKVAFMPELCISVLRKYTVKGMRFLWEDEVPVQEVDEIEFDDPAVYTDFKGTFNSQLKHLSEELGRRFPDTCANFLLESTRELIAASASFPTEVAAREAAPASPGEAVEAFLADALLLRQWDSLFLTMDVLLKVMCERSHVRLSQECGHTLIGVVQQLVSWEVPRTGPSALAFDALEVVRGRALQYCAPFLAYPISTTQLASVFCLLHDTLLVPPASSASASRKRSMANGIATVCNTCKKSIVGTEALRNEIIVPKLANLLACADTDLSMEAKSSVRESLVSLSEGVEDPAMKKQLLQTALSDVVEYLKYTLDTIFASPSSLLHACTDPSMVTSGKPTPVSKVNLMLEALYSSAKRVAVPTLPAPVWRSGQMPTADTVSRHCHFFHVWQEILPLLLCVCRSLHGLWSPGNRGQYAELFTPTVNEIVNATKLNGQGSKVRSTGLQDEVKSDLLLLRLLLYQLLGQACAHQALYVHSLRQSFVLDLFSHTPTMENGHCSHLLVHFMEPFVLHCPPYFYSEIAPALNSFMKTTVYRLGVAWGLTTGAVDATEIEVFRQCSLNPAGGTFGGIVVDEDGMEASRDFFVRSLTLKVADFLSALGMTKGALAVPIEKVDNSTRNHPSKSKKALMEMTKKQLKQHELQKEKEFDHELAWRGAAMAAFTTGSGGAVVTIAGEYIQACLALLSLPDTHACRRGVVLANVLLDASFQERSLMPTIGKLFFQVALLVLVQNERWLVGMEWELTELVGNIYADYVLGLRDVTCRKDLKQCLCDEPRGVLLNIGLPTAVISSLEKQLCTVLSKKKRRDFMKDFINSSVLANKKETLLRLRGLVGINVSRTDDYDAAADSNGLEGASNITQQQGHDVAYKSVQNIAGQRPRKAAPKKAPEGTVFDSSNLFGGA